MGCEFAQESEWADGRSLDWWLLDDPAHYRVHNLVKELNSIYRGHKALWGLDSDPAGFQWIDADDNTGNLFSFLRFGERDRGGDDVLAVIANYSGQDKEWVRIGVPRGGQWKVVLDTSGFDADGRASQAGVVVDAEDGDWQGQPHHVTVRVAAFSTLYLEPFSS
jgi:1,4-alpha-glucan branching enzyme